MDLFSLIETNSFSSIWFWILIAISWSSGSHFIIGVPFDLVQRARREGGHYEERVHILLEINIDRLRSIQSIAGQLIVLLASFLLTGLLLLGFVYDVEFFQAAFLLCFPWVFVGALTLRAVRKLDGGLPQGEELYKFFSRLRLSIQFVGLISIFVTSVWGMYYAILISSFPNI